MKAEHRARGVLMVAATIALVHATRAQDRNRPADDTKHPIVILGCVRGGTDPGTFMLMNVKEIDPVNGAQSVPADEFGRDVLYALNSSKGLSGLLGRRVEVKGTVDLSDTHKARVTVVDDQSERKDRNIEIKGDGTTVTVETDTKPAVSPDAEATPITSTEPNRVMHRLDVTSIRAVSSGPCSDRDVIFKPVARPKR